MHEMQAEYGPIMPVSEKEDAGRLRSAAQHERSMREMQKLEDQSKLLQQADDVFNDIEHTKDRYL